MTAAGWLGSPLAVMFSPGTLPCNNWPTSVMDDGYFVQRSAALRQAYFDRGLAFHFYFAGVVPDIGEYQDISFDDSNGELAGLIGRSAFFAGFHRYANSPERFACSRGYFSFNDGEWYSGRQV